MTVVLLRLLEKIGNMHDRPQNCPHCGSAILHRWGGTSKTVTDTQQSVAILHRYRCNDCERTFRVYPAGMDRSPVSHRIHRLAAIAWALGMSCRDVAAYFDQFGIHLSHATIWRDGQKLIAMQNGPETTDTTKRFNLDSHFIPRVSSRLGVVIAMDLGAGRISVLGTVDEYNPRKVISWLRNLVDGVAELVTTETSNLYNQGLISSEVRNADSPAR
jgi:transposase-like protein